MEIVAKTGGAVVPIMLLNLYSLSRRLIVADMKPLTPLLSQHSSPSVRDLTFTAFSTANPLFAMSVPNSQLAGQSLPL